MEPPLGAAARGAGRAAGVRAAIAGVSNGNRAGTAECRTRSSSRRITLRHIGTTSHLSSIRRYRHVRQGERQQGKPWWQPYDEVARSDGEAGRARNIASNQSGLCRGGAPTARCRGREAWLDGVGGASGLRGIYKLLGNDLCLIGKALENVLVSPAQTHP